VVVRHPLLDIVGREQDVSFIVFEVFMVYDLHGVEVGLSSIGVLTAVHADGMYHS
jgi:hypothetical protein